MFTDNIVLPGSVGLLFGPLAPTADHLLYSPLAAFFHLIHIPLAG
jgi:hypothetical protein